MTGCSSETKATPPYLCKEKNLKMVATHKVKISKTNEHVPASKVAHDVKAKVSPGSSPTSVNDELMVLRARNKVLTEALQAIRDTASLETKKNFDLVWFAKYRYRFPNHKASKRIDVEYKDAIDKLRSDDGDFHHGFHTGLLAASRMFKEEANILHINEFEELSSELMEESAKHSKRIEEAKKQFPHIEVGNESFPEA